MVSHLICIFYTLFYTPISPKLMQIFPNGEWLFYSFMEFYVIHLKQNKGWKFDHSTTLNIKGGPNWVTWAEKKNTKSRRLVFLTASCTASAAVVCNDILDNINVPFFPRIELFLVFFPNRQDTVSSPCNMQNGPYNLLPVKSLCITDDSSSWQESVWM